MIALRDAVANEDWPIVRRVGAGCLGRSYGARRVLEVEGRTDRHRATSGTELSRLVDNAFIGFAAISDTNTRSQVFEKIRDEFETADTSLLDQLKDGLKALEEGDQNVSLTTLLGIDKPLPHSPAALSIVCDAVIGSLVRGLLGLVHADFNLAFIAHETHRPQLADADLQTPMQNLVGEYRSNLRSHQMGLQEALASSADLERVGIAIDGLVSFVELRTPMLARSQAVIFQAANGLLDAGRGGSAEALGHLAADAGGLTREGIASHAAASLIAIELSGRRLDADTSGLHSRAASLSFDVALPNGTNTELSKLNQVAEGKFVEIAGFVQVHKAIRAPDGKLLSRIEILDPSSGALARAVAVFTHLAHAGVTPGGFCRVSGHFKPSSDLFDGEPAVEIDRLSLADLAKESWRIAFLRSANLWYEPWRNGTNIQWSLGPYRIIDNGTEVDELASSFGAGELVFLPFVRDRNQA